MASGECCSTGWGGMMDDCQQRADSKDDVFLLGARGLMNRPGMCCALLDDFDWVVPPYEPDLVLAGRNVDIGVMDVGRDVRVLPDVFPVVVEETDVMPVSLPVVVERRPQVGCESDLLLPVWEVVVDIADIRRDIGNLPDVFPVILDIPATVPITLPVDVEMSPQVDEGPDVVLAGRDMKVDDTYVVQDTRLLTDVRPDSENALPVLQDDCSVMSFLSDQSVFLSYDDCGDDRLSPEISDRVSLNCHVDMDSLWMVSWDDCRNVETGSRTGVSDWRSIVCCVAILSRMPEFPDVGCLNCFRDIGKNCVLDLNTRGTYPRVRPPECGLETLAQTPSIRNCRVAEVQSVAVALRCMLMHGCAGNGHSPGDTQDAREVGVSPGEMECAEDSAYIRPDSVVESPMYVWSVTGSLLFGSPLRCVRGVQQPPLPSRYLTWLCLFVWWGIMSSGIDLPAVNQVGASTTASTPLPGTFLGLTLDLRSDRLYDLVDDIPDVMGLRTLQPSAAIVKVMSVPDSRGVRVVTPDDHVNIGFHEILIHDLADEELPFVTLSELGCLRLDWPKTFLRLCLHISLIWTRCGRNVGSGLVPHSLELVQHVVTYTAESGTTYHLIPHGAGAAVAMPGDVLYGVEGHSSGLRRSYEKGA